jgi:transposase InsO family protein
MGSTSSGDPPPLIQALAGGPRRQIWCSGSSRPCAERLWVADITYLRTSTGWLYLAVVLDVFSRRVVGWAMRALLETTLVLDALNMALWNRRPAWAGRPRFWWGSTARWAAPRSRSRR